jgi:phosphatidylglycerophosphate synthase
MYIVLMDGRDPRFLGGSARTRNARVAARAGAAVRSFSTLPGSQTDLVPRPALPDASIVSDVTTVDIAVLVPAHVGLMLSLFEDPVFIQARDSGLQTRLDDGSGAWIAVVPARELRAVAADMGCMSALPRRPLSTGSILDLSTRISRQRSARMALRATQKITDGWVSRTLNRPVSRACSHIALMLGMNAMAASVVTLLVGFVSAWVAAQPGYLAFALTGLLFHVASVIDGVDGEIARVTLTESPAGAKIDTIVDQLTYLVCFAGVTIGWMREGSGTAAMTMTVAIGVALVLSLFRAGRFVSTHAENASFVFIDRAVRRAASDTGHLPLRLAAGAFTLLRRDLFAVIFLAVSLTGVRAAVPALILTGVVIANLTFSVYGSELAAAASVLSKETRPAGAPPAARLYSRTARSGTQA